MPTCTLADEILMPGEGQIRALITVGGNPAVALSDQDRMLEALDSLELGVCVDIVMSPTARRADYVLPAKHHLEREDVTEFMDMFFEVPYAFYSQAVLEAAPDVLDDWEVFAGLAARMGDSIELFVDPPMEDLEARLELSPPGIGEELSAVRDKPTLNEINASREAPFTHQMICSRLRNVANSVR